MWGLVFFPAILLWLSPVLFIKGPRLSKFPDVNLALLVFTPLFVLIHEIGHAIAGRVAGFRISEIRLGYGAFVAAPKWLGITWHLRAFPYGGFCLGFPKKEPATRGQSTVFILGGPLVNLALLIVGILMLPGDDADRTALWHRLQVPWIFIICNGWALLWSLLPIFAESEGRRIPNDLLILVELWWGKEALRRFARFDDSMKRFGGGFPIIRIWGFRIAGIACFLLAIVFFFVVADRNLLRWLAGGLVLAGTLLLLTSHNLRRPKLSEAWRDVPENSWAKIGEAHGTDQKTLLDGMASLDQLNETWSRILTELERGRGEDAAARVALLLGQYPRCLALRDLQSHTFFSTGKADAGIEQIDLALAIPGISDGSRVSLEYRRFHAFAKAGRTAEAVESARLALAKPFDGSAKAALLDRFAAITLLPAHGEFLPQAEDWSAEAMRLDPSGTVRVTRAGILYESGRIEEAEAILGGVLQEHLESSDFGIAHLYLALIANQRGDKKRALKLSWIAFNNHPDRRLVERLASDGLASG
jgi:hypothetical protein